MKINLNDKIQCSLTPRAEDIIRSYLTSLFYHAPTPSVLIDRSFRQLTMKNDQGKAEYTFWEFCSIFGPEMTTGADIFLQDIEIK